MNFEKRKWCEEDEDEINEIDREENFEKKRFKKAPQEKEPTIYFDSRDVQLDIFNELISDLQMLQTREEKRKLIRQRLPECYLVFVYAFHPSLSFGAINCAKDIDQVDEEDIAATTAPPSFFGFLDVLQDGGEYAEEKEDSARQICAWLKEHSEHTEIIRVILDRDPHGFHRLFGPLVSFYSLESNLRWYFEQQKQSIEEALQQQRQQ